MQRNHVLYALMVAFSLVGFVLAVETAAANEAKVTKPDQQQGQDQRTTKQKLERGKKGEGNAAFKELNKHAPGGPEASPAVQGSNTTGGGGTGTGSGGSGSGSGGK